MRIKPTNLSKRTDLLVPAIKKKALPPEAIHEKVGVKLRVAVGGSCSSAPFKTRGRT
jgi:hypothetical protein